MIGFVGCGEVKQTESAVNSEPAVEEAIPVAAQRVQNEPFKISKTYTGTLEGVRQADVIAKVVEQVIEISVEIGESVSRGQLLARLDRSGPSSRYHQAESASVNAQRNAARMQSLFDVGAVSRQALDDAQTQSEVARAEFDASQNLVDLTCPINGTVTALHYTLGNVTQAGMPVITIAALDEMLIVFHVSESDLQFMKERMSVDIYSELRNDLRQQGKLVKLSRSADVSTRTFEAKARFPNTEDQWFRPGMFGIAAIQYSTSENVIAVPRSALQSGQKGSSVFVIAGDHVERKPVEIGISNDHSVVVNGLVPTDQVVTMGANHLVDGSKITLVEAAKFTTASSSEDGSQK
jgi:RND family efflux transporter MFP subunit